VTQVEGIAELDPRAAAALVVDSSEGREAWLDEFAAQLDRMRAGEALARVLQVWGLSQSAAGRLFGVSRQAVSKWLAAGVPEERVESVADLAAATDLLVRYLKRDRIPAVVRRQAAALGGRSLLELVEAGQTRQVLAACRDMFAFERAQS